MEETDSGHKPANKNRKNPGSKIIGIVTLVAVAIVSFYGGVAFQKSHQKTITTSMFGSGNGQFSNGFGGGAGGRRMRGFGTVSSVSAYSITVRNPRSGSTDIYTINSSTSITDNGSTVYTSDIKTGDTVIIRTAGSSSKTATEIMVNPSFNGGPGGAGMGPTTQAQ